MQKLRTIKGTHDILPWDIHKWQKIESVLRDVFASYVCKEIRTPVFESTNLFSRGVGEFSDIVSKEMYSFQDKGGDSLTLRPELTASVARSYIQHNYQQESPLHKLWYFGPLFRQERPQAGRQRQFYQYGIELIGSPFPEADAEAIDIACSVYRKLGLKNWELHINSIGSIEARKVYMEVLRDSLKAHKGELCETCQDRYDGNILRLFDCKNPGCQEVMKEHAPSILDHLSEEDKQHFEQVKKLLDAAGIDYTINPALVRGLDYYTRTTFEIKGTALGAQDALCGGGRYDKLISDLDGPDTPAVGFAAGVERLVIAMEAEELFNADQSFVDLYIAPMDIACLEGISPLVHSLRDKGFRVHLELMRRSVKAMMRDANRQNARWVAVVGEQELQSGNLRLKNMQENIQQEINLNEIENILKK
ncbi:MAG: histidine--tRNA ligase [Candidatus Marinimicrobia bacterium]|nr:histidine--tRNA ligase [Candidatus Neomarinimicrobiota bacterium]